MAPPSALAPSADASYLRQLLERQPACLIRVRLDGVLLASNDAALSLFGVGARRAVLNTSLADRIVPAQRTKWQEFTTRCWVNGAASLECDFAVPDDDDRPVLIQGVALKDHPDGMESLLLNLRDQSQMHRLEHSIQSAQLDRVGNEERHRSTRDQVEAAIAQRLKLAALADEHQAERQRLTEALNAQTADYQRRQARFVELEKKVEESQLLLLGREREHRDRVAALETAHAADVAAVAGREQQELEAVKLRLQAATAEQARLQAVVAEYDVDRRRIAAEHQRTIAALEQSLARAEQEAARVREQSRQALAELRSQPTPAQAEPSPMAARADDHERERDLMRAEHQRALTELETRNTVALAELRSQLAQMSAEQGRLIVRAEGFERERDLVRAEHHRALADLEASKHAVTELRWQLSQTSAEQGRLAARVEEHEHERDRMLAEHHRTLIDKDAEHHRALADMATGNREALIELRSRLAQTAAEQNHPAARVEDPERERSHLIAEHHRALADLDAAKGEALADLRSQLSQAFADQRRLAAAVDEHEHERDRVIAEHHRALADMDAGKREALAELRLQLSQAFADQRRLAVAADEQERDRDRMLADHYLILADLETRKRDGLAELRAELSQATADHSRVLAARAEEHQRERDRICAEHNLAIADLHASKGEALTELRSQLSKAAAEQRRLTALLEEYDRERERIAAEHHLAIADLQASKKEAVAELRSQLSTAAAEQRRLTALLEEHDRERERIGAEHRRALAELQTGKREAVAECERLLTEVQQALLVRDGSDVEVERRLVDEINEGMREKVDGERLAGLRSGLTRTFSELQAVLTDGEVLNELVDVEHGQLERPFIEAGGGSAADETDREPLADVQAGLRGEVSTTQTVNADADPANDLFDNGDEAFVRHLLDGIPAPPLPGSLTEPAVDAAAPLSEMQTVAAGNQPGDDVFDAQDDAFVRSLMDGTAVAARQPGDQTDDDPQQDQSELPPAPPEDS